MTCFQTSCRVNRFFRTAGMKNSVALIFSVFLAVCGICHGAELSTEEPVFGEDVPNYWAYVVPAHLNVRAGPSMKHNVHASLNSGDIVLVTHQSRDWAAIPYGKNGTLYVSRKYIIARISAMQAHKTQIRRSKGIESGQTEKGSRNWWVKPVALAVDLTAKELLLFSLATGLCSRYCSKIVDAIKGTKQ